ncbi:hypothetical protein SDC9_191693 [bioreactor metagenome]|uniref:Bacterial bifunctional deaminase-reductase C-terminal domain-containing protein n=1 Tax=bioreactor metagenome TaxID=1076179 RepID=A0A645I063_9ZZZZ
MSVLIEAGAKLNGEAISIGLVDKIYHFIAPKIIADNNEINAFEGRNINEISESIIFQVKETKKIGEDILIISYKRQ